MQNVRIVEIAEQKMVSSQPGMFGDGRIETFMLWMERQKKGVWPKDFLTEEMGESGPQLRWLHLYEEGMDIPEELEMILFPRGLYAVVTLGDRDDNADLLEHVQAFLAENGFEMDAGRPMLGNVITSPAVQRIMGYCQMDRYFPIRPAAQQEV